MKKFLSKNNWWFYFILTFLISWPVWVQGKVFLPENLTMITFILGAFGPFVAAMIILSMTEGTPVLKQWLKPLLISKSISSGIFWEGSSFPL